MFYFNKKSEQPPKNSTTFLKSISWDSPFKHGEISQHLDTLGFHWWIIQNLSDILKFASQDVEESDTIPYI
jgi:hypothetical protein